MGREGEGGGWTDTILHSTHTLSAGEEEIKTHSNIYQNLPQLIAPLHKRVSLAELLQVLIM